MAKVCDIITTTNDKPKGAYGWQQWALIKYPKKEGKRRKKREKGGKRGKKTEKDGKRGKKREKRGRKEKREEEEE